VTRDSMLAFLYKLGMSAEKSWLRLRGFEWLAKVIGGVHSKTE
jgi:putative transposase